MTTDTTRPEEVDGLAHLGTAEDGTEHYADGFEDTAYVVADGEVVLRTDIPSVPRYVEHVRDVTGWADLRYSDKGLDEWLDAMIETVEAA